mmetsp:Transcript_20187/g.68498  ORF Transcript_20187/g.68498 Transcript_20187/m.68498 type:complete len:232 (+) Transcript_20187:18-713(+)
MVVPDLFFAPRKSKRGVVCGGGRVATVERSGVGRGAGMAAVWGGRERCSRVEGIKACEGQKKIYASASSGLVASTVLPVSFSYTSRSLSEVSVWKKPVPLSDPGASLLATTRSATSPSYLAPEAETMASIAAKHSSSFTAPSISTTHTSEPYHVSGPEPSVTVGDAPGATLDGSGVTATLLPLSRTYTGSRALLSVRWIMRTLSSLPSSSSVVSVGSTCSVMSANSRWGPT